MHPLLAAYTIYSFRKELIYVAAAFLIVLSLPFVAVFIVTHAGVNVVSDALVGINPNTNTIEIKNPADGSVVTQLTKAIAWPLLGVITLEFAQSSGYQVFHTGMDIANTSGIGAPITPIMEGTVIYAGEIFWGYGKHIIIDHGDHITSLYAHLDRIYVIEGQEVKIGEVIGTQGSTGWSTGPHLHLETRVSGIPVNPWVFLNTKSDD